MLLMFADVEFATWLLLFCFHTTVLSESRACQDQYEVVSTAKDNTGDKTFVEDIVFPTLHFPSDHCVTYTTLHATTPASL